MLLLLYVLKRNKICFSYFDNKNIVITGASSGIGKSISSILEKKTKSKLHLLPEVLKIQHLKISLNINAIVLNMKISKILYQK